MSIIDNIKKAVIDEEIKPVNAALNLFFPQLIYGYLRKYGGELISFHAHTTEKKIGLRIELPGESELLDFTIIYELFQEEDNTFIKAASIQTEREWINLLLAELIKQGFIKPLQVL